MKHTVIKADFLDFCAQERTKQTADHCTTLFCTVDGGNTYNAVGISRAGTADDTLAMTAVSRTETHTAAVTLLTAR